MGTADGSAIGSPTSGNFYLFIDSNNSNLLTRRDSGGTDLVYGVGEGIDALGWVTMNDTVQTVSSPLVLASGVDKALSFTVSNSNDTYAPNGYNTSDFFNGTTNRILSPVLGAAYTLRLTFKCTPAQSSRQLDVSYSIGTSLSSQIIIDSRSVELRTAGSPTNVSITSLVFSLATFLANGMEIILNASTNADCYDFNMVIARIS